MHYTPGSIWSALVNGSDDIDLVIDIRYGMSQLPEQEQNFLTLLASGQTGAYAKHETGIKGNQTLLKRRILLRLSMILNGESSG